MVVTYMADMEKCMHKLDEKGFTDQYKIDNGKLLCSIAQGIFP
jgi:hypothetical protein